MIVDLSKEIKKIFIISDLENRYTDFMDFLILHSRGRKSRKKKNTSEDEDVYEAFTFSFDEFPDAPIEKHNNIEKSVFFVCGNCGFGKKKLDYYLSALEEINDFLAKIKSHLIIVRGIEDDPSYFDDNKINLSNIKAVSDYSVILTKNYNILCVGGGISYNRSWKIFEENRRNSTSYGKKTKLYWEDEATVFNEEKLKEIISNITINGIITYSSPKEEYINIELASDTDWHKIDNDLIKDVKREYEVQKSIVEFLKDNEQKISFIAYNSSMNGNTCHVDDNDIMVIGIGTSKFSNNLQDIISNEKRKYKHRMSFKRSIYKNIDTRGRFMPMEIEELNINPEDEIDEIHN